MKKVKLSLAFMYNPVFGSVYAVKLPVRKTDTLCRWYTFGSTDLYQMYDSGVGYLKELVPATPEQYEKLLKELDREWYEIEILPLTYSD